jgi:signal transduction histidine kinase
MRLQFQMLIFTLLVALISCGALVYRLYDVARADAVVFATESAVRQAAPIRRMVQIRLTTLRQNLVQFADLVARGGSSRPSFPFEFEVVALIKPRQNGPGWSPLWIESRPQGRTSKIQQGQEAVLVQGFPADRLADGDIFLKRLANDKGDPIYSVAVSVIFRPPETPTQTARGILVGLSSQSPLASLSEESIVADGSTFIFTDQGYVVSHSRPEQIGMQYADSEALVQRALEKARARESWVMSDDEGADSLRHLESIDKTNLMIGVQIPMLLAQSSARRVLQVGLISSGLLIVLVLSLAWFFGRSVSQPIADLSKALRILQQGSIEARIPQSLRRDEIGELTRSLAEIPPAVLAGRPELMAIRSTSGPNDSTSFQGSGSDGTSGPRSIHQDSAVLDRLAVERSSALQQVTEGLRRALREPLATILAQVHLVQIKMQGQPSDSELTAAREHASSIEREARKARESLEKISGLGLEFNTVDFDRKIPISSTLGLLCDRWDETLSIEGIKVRRDIPEAPFLRGNEEQISEAFSQILSNARLAIRGRPKREVAVRLETLNEHAYISFSDSGAGMSKEALRRAHEPFFQEFSSHDGFGLGLTFARSVAERHGGSLSIESTVGEGSVVTVKLPIRSEDRRDFQASTVNRLASKVGQTFRRAQQSATVAEMAPPAPAPPPVPNAPSGADDGDSAVHHSPEFQVREETSSEIEGGQARLASAPREEAKADQASGSDAPAEAVRDANVIIRKPKRRGSVS